jgi:hypothetical protein
MGKLLLLGSAALIWAVICRSLGAAALICRNDIVFDNIPTKTYMQVLFRGTHWLRLWAQLQRHAVDSSMIKTACKVLESMLMEIFANFGWRFWNRIESS